VAISENENGAENNKPKEDGYILNQSLQKSVKGMITIFVGTIVGTALGITSRVLVARFYSVGEYGLYGLGISIISLLSGVSYLGIIEAAPRYISYYRGKRDNEKVKSVINSSLIIIIISSITVATLLFFLSDFVANRIFGIDKLSTVIKILAVGIPFLALLQLTVGIFRGFESAKENVYFSNFLLRLLTLSSFGFVIISGLAFDYIIIAYVLSVIITSSISVFYLIKRLPEAVKRVKRSSLQIRTLLSFSLPLVFSGLGWKLILSVDKLMLGILTTDVRVGLYNAASPIAVYLKIFLSSAVFIFQPVAARLLAENRIYEVKRDYQILTKWLFTLTFPFFVVLLLFPGTVISIIFGSKYMAAATALQLLTIAYFINTFLGPNGATITTFGKTKVLMYFNLIGGGINVALNYFLIPLFGIEGAALSTMFSLIIINILNGGYLFKISRIHPLRRNFVFPVVLSSMVLFSLYFFIIYFHLESISFLFKIIFCLMVILFYFLVMLLLRSYDNEDLQLLLLFERKIGIRFNILRKIIKKFM